MSLPMRWETEEVIAPVEAVVAPDSRRNTHERPSERYSLRLATLLGICVLTVFGLGLAVNRPSEAATLQLRRAVTAAGKVSLLSATAERRLGFVTVTGSVANQTTQQIGSVEAIVELLDAQNRPVGLESAMVAVDPLPAQDSAPFQVVMLDTSKATSFRVRFKKHFGSGLN